MMTPMVARAPVAEDPSAVSITRIVEVLKKLTPEQLSEVFQYILFLQYKPMLLEDAAEDEALWQAVLAHQAYKANHLDEEPEVYNSKEALEEALANL
jgi:hypothetical protein